MQAATNQTLVLTHAVNAQLTTSAQFRLQNKLHVNPNPRLQQDQGALRTVSAFQATQATQLLAAVHVQQGPSNPAQVQRNAQSALQEVTA